MLLDFKVRSFGFLACLFAISCHAKPGNFIFNGNTHNVSNVNFFTYWLGMFDQSLPGISKPPTSVTPVTPEEVNLESNETLETPEITGSDPNENISLTDEEEDILKFGIEVNYSFIETRSPDDHFEKLISSPGCPFSGNKDNAPTHPLNRHVWVHLGVPPRCFLTGTPGPCPEGMTVGLQPNSTEGICKCSCYNKLDMRESDIFDPYADTKQKFCHRESKYAYDHYAKYEGKCYKLLTQGPCKSGEVFVFDTPSQEIICKKRECPEAELSDDETIFGTYAFLYNLTCSRLGQVCDSEHRILAPTENHPNPACIYPAIYGTPQGISTGISKVICTQRYSKILRSCLPFDDNFFRSIKIG